MTVELLAPAKLNLALEITGRRPDGYHELVTVMQTIDLCDRVRVSNAPELVLAVGGSAERGVPREGGRNLAFMAARALATATGDKHHGARIELDKRIPAGMGLGGGSTDAAAVLRGLNRLWGLGFSDDRLCEVGATVGSDVPFFVVAGSALVTGRGERVEPLPDGLEMPLSLFVADAVLEDKTRHMYGLVGPQDYSDGHKARSVAESLRNGAPVTPSHMVNAFDAHVHEAFEQVGEAMALCREAGVPVLTSGSGPGFFAPVLLENLPPHLVRELERAWGVKVLSCRTLGRGEALTVREV